MAWAFGKVALLANIQYMTVLVTPPNGDHIDALRQKILEEWFSSLFKRILRFILFYMDRCFSCV